MVRTQISLDRELRNKARHRATELGISLAAYIRRLLSRDLERGAVGADPSAVFNLGDSGSSDIAAEKARMLGEAASAGRHRAIGG